MLWIRKIQKKHLQFHQIFKKKIDSSNFNTSGKKSFSVEKKNHLKEAKT